MTRKMTMLTMMIATAAVLLSSLAVSCTQVDFEGHYLEEFDGEDGLEDRRKSKIGFTVEWPEGISEEQMPEKLIVIMNRVQNISRRKTYVVDNLGNIIVAENDEIPDDVPVDDVPEGISEGDSSEEEVPEDPSHPYMYNGTYSVAAVSCVNEDDFTIPLSNEFDDVEDDLTVSMRDLYVNVPLISDADKIEQGYLDFNYNCPYIRHTEPVYFVRPILVPSKNNQSGSAYIAADSEDEIVEIRLIPRPLTREISFSLELEREEGVAIDRFVGVISGVPQKVQLATGYVSDTDTGKMPFEMTNVSGNRWEGKVNALGLIAPDKDDVIVGPGILSVIIHASAVDEYGETHRRVFHQSLNIKAAIEEAGGVMLQAADKSGYRFDEFLDDSGNPREIKSYDIRYDSNVAGKGMLRITKNNVFSGDGSGFEVWNPYEGDTEEDPKPGLNPEL